MGWGQAIILLDGCVYVVRFFDPVSITLFYILDMVGLAFHVSILRISLLWNPSSLFGYLPLVFMVHLARLDAVTKRDGLFQWVG